MTSTFVRAALRVTAAALLFVTGCGRPAGDAEALIGVWRSQLPPATLRLGARSFEFQSGQLTKWGTVERTPFRVAFVLERTSSPAFDLYCRDTVDVYDWWLEDGRLRFRAVGRPCDRAARAVLVAGTWAGVAR
jgi:hypothetical protein